MYEIMKFIERAVGVGGGACNAKVASERKLKAAAESRAVDGSDDRDGQVFHFSECGAKLPYKFSYLQNAKAR